MNVMRKIRDGQARGGSRQAGYTLVEIMFATAITSIMFFTGMSAITFNRVQMAKDKDRAIISDFAVHYMETLRGLSFDDMVSGMPINPLYDGITASETGTRVTLRIPPSGNWVSLNDTNYQNFCYDLAWLKPKSPEMRVTLTTVNSGATVRTRAATLEVRWDAPLGRGPKQQLRMDIVRARDLESSQ